MKGCPNNKHGGGNMGIEFNLHELLYQTGLHLEETLLILAEGQALSMK